MSGIHEPGSHPDVQIAYARHLTQVVAMLEGRFPYMKGRSSRINLACNDLAVVLGFSESQKESLSLVARFHDIGMLGVPDALVTASRALSNEERALIDRHADVGGRMIFTLFPNLPDVAEGIWFHHERPDGRGPHKLEAGEIPIVAGTVGLVQAVEAMANPRPHKDVLSLAQITAELKRGRGTQFDPNIVDIFNQRAEQLYRMLVIDDCATPRNSSGVDAAPEPPSRGPPSQQIPDTSPKAAAEAIANLQPVIRREELTKLVTEGLDLRPLGVAAQNVLAVSGSSQCTAEDVAGAIGSDQTLAIRLLKLANSSAYCRGKQVKDVKEAVQRIGIRDVRNLVMTLSVVRNYQGRLAKYLDPLLFWEHSVACGVAAQHLAKACSSRNEDRCFLWGVLHDVGRLVLADHIPEPYTKVWDAAESLGLPLEAVEGALILLDHAHILRLAMEHWKFPNDLIVPVVNHHMTLAKLERLGPDHMEGALLIALANRLVHALLLGSSGNDVIYPADDLAKKLGLSPADVESLMEPIRQETSALKVALLARADLDTWPDFVPKMRGLLTTDVRVVSAEDSAVLDTYRMFFDSLCGNDREDGDSNLGLLYVPDTRQFASATTKYEEAERAAGAGALPVLIVYSRGKIDEDEAWLKDRVHRVVRAPVPVRTLITSVNELLAEARSPVSV